MDIVYGGEPSVDDMALIDDDEALARALQEEYNAADARASGAVYESGGIIPGMPVATAVPTAPTESEVAVASARQNMARQNSRLGGGSNHTRRSPSRQGSSRTAGASARRPPSRSNSASGDGPPRRPPSRSSSREMDAATMMNRQPSARAVSGNSNHSSSRRQPPSRSSSADTLETIRAAQEWRDEQYARRIQQELLKAQEQSRIKAAPTPAATVAAAAQYKRSSGTDTPRTIRSLSMSSDLAQQAAVWDDEEVARRVQQEEEDERLARNITRLQASQAAASASQRAIYSQHRQRNRPGCLATFCRCLFPLAVIATMSLVIYFVMFAPESLPDWMPDPEDFVNEDPFNQQAPGDTSRWRNRGKGLKLMIVNALDEEWYPFFYTAVNQWDAGDPDALTLETQTQEPDKACTSIPGKLKVCNGNYGETFWRGINKLLLEGPNIYASAARMNEYYFRRNDDDQRQYTMCHEMGHGFGLPHTDESFVNKDLGNCMDYTNRPKNNRQPDRSNFLFLEELYGVVPGSLPSNSTVSSTGTVEQQQSVFGGNNRLLSSSSVVVPDRVLRAHQDLDHEIEQGHTSMTSENGWNLLHRSPHGEAHEKHLGDGFKVQVHFLLA